MINKDFHLVDEDLKDIHALLDPNLTFTKIDGNTEISNFPCVFDIETTSQSIWHEKNTPKEWVEKHAWAYAFVLGINGRCVLGRTWEDFFYYIKEISRFYHISMNRRLVIYVHNLAFEFQFIRKRFKWDAVFSNKEREPIYARTANGIEFRCSYLLSGYGLAKLGDTLLNYPVKKLSGDLDYSLIRTSETPLTDKEKHYILHDGLVVMSYIQELIDTYGSIAKLPITKTGFVRKYCRRICFFNGERSHSKKTSESYKYYRDIIDNLTLTTAQYTMLKRAFQGGFTHANAAHARKTLHNVASFDFCSSYPSVMVLDEFPMSKGVEVKNLTTESLHRYLKEYCCLFDLYIEDLEPKLYQDNPISSSKCFILKNPTINNGRVVRADKVAITCTETDLSIYSAFYTWKKAHVRNFIVFEKGRLPKPFIEAILGLYENKTKLKNVAGMEAEYLHAKEWLNSCYGMTVTDIAKPEAIYDDSGLWAMDIGNLDDKIDIYNKSKNRFLFYPWGVWVTAYARRNLFTGIQACGKDYVYSDTDSIKILNPEKHRDYINSYNDYILYKIDLASKATGIPKESFMPCTQEGKKKIIGVWENDANYKTFKTLGAKRYIDEDEDGKLSLTVSGIDKKSAVPYLEARAKKDKVDVFDLFDDKLNIPAEFTGKATHTYIDEEEQGDVIDYLGNRGHWHEFSSVHLMNASYSLSMVEDYIDYIFEMTEREESENEYKEKDS